ncbi:hypothetical protein ES332_D01G086200v1 [Gossypium tomentosum]|uniref:Peptidase A1 domain-containing protein n=1 Tax=Gossypium tomentosum TaxID=34277 RepID=A0A5D2M6R5_GOSTO|nr:hypothetical protein ES332_D01G086200v1 [Gossypium tomentosum]
MVQIPLFPISILFLCFITFFQATSASSKPTGLSMKLIRRTYFRAQNFDSFLSLNQSEDNVLVHLPLCRVPKDLAYVLLMDTSSLIWTQCAPCIKCYQQKTSLYNSRISMTYRKLPSNQPFCQGRNSPFRCHNNECVYDIRYGDLSQPTTPRTKGVASFETFHIHVDSSHTRVINDMIFGCSNDNSDTGFENSQISGILGLSRGPDGLTSQLAKRGIIQNLFSYCLVRRQHPPTCRNIRSTPFLNIDRNHYSFELLDISLRKDGLGGSLIDSRTLVSRIDENTVRRNAYQEVGFRDFATMTLHFKGGDYLIDGKYMHYFSNKKKGEGYFCVALSKSSKTILGAWQQQNMRIIYDMNGGRLQWVTETCANDHSP